MPYLLILVLLSIALLLSVLLPSRAARWKEDRRREQIEDSLKHLLDREQEGRRATPESLAGNLGINAAKTTRLISHMEAQNLLEHRGLDLHLTGEGKRWALQVVRAHRLWERYLADEARMPLEKIHTEAHRLEHHITPEEVDALEAALGYPARDPHGDPIPSRAGEFPAQESIPLTAWESDAPARIVHLEDEPPIAYAQILAAGLSLGKRIQILEKSPERYILSDGEEEYRLAPVVAANIYVAPLAEEPPLPNDAIPLTKLPLRETGEILAIDKSVQGFTRRRFLDLGMTPGAKITPRLQNAFGEPRAYRIRGALIALRNDQAQKIWVRKLT
jgi:DtxR family Mn-dependent transcriptional regulator